MFTFYLIFFKVLFSCSKYLSISINKGKLKLLTNQANKLTNRKTCRKDNNKKVCIMAQKKFFFYNSYLIKFTIDKRYFKFKSNILYF